ncbi:hypothetical protein OK074_4971 [Actinobacteria bacterium OK074]|nr:hypothetical protein OK074_4971 [Actinobacteria bacterium OK074]
MTRTPSSYGTPSYETPPYYEAPVSADVLLAFDGRVLEVFRYADAARYHVWEEPWLEFTSGRSPKVRIRSRIGSRRTFPYDEQLLPGIRALADAVAQTVAERQRP